jgi:glycosyltransferase involved in cell wall biosynthesis
MKESIGGFNVLIPAYNPESSLVGTVKGLVGAPRLNSILIINDGSSSKLSVEVFRECNEFGVVTIIDHVDNKGKGAALKTGFRYLNNEAGSKDVITTADADGQHLASDIIKVSLTSLEKDSIVLGCRSFGFNVPLRSKIGNLITRYIFSLFAGHKVSDTQTGLRAYPSRYLCTLLGLDGEGYEYEFDCLITIVKKYFKEMVEVPIKTIYENNNESSHFQPIRDSLKIYAVLLRYGAGVGLLAVVDFLLYVLLTSSGFAILSSILVSRFLLAYPYIWILRNKVFQSGGNLKLQVIITLSLMAVNTTFLWGGIEYLVSMLDFGKSFAMILVSLLLFSGNFLIQRSVYMTRSCVSVVDQAGVDREGS